MKGASNANDSASGAASAGSSGSSGAMGVLPPQSQVRRATLDNLFVITRTEPYGMDGLHLPTP